MPRTLIAALATVLVAAAAVVPATATADIGENSHLVVKLTKKEQQAHCGSFRGTIVYDNGTSVDCQRGELLI